MRRSKLETTIAALKVLGIRPGTRLWLKAIARAEEASKPRVRVVIDLQSVVCPRCLAMPGARCTSKLGPRQPHEARARRARAAAKKAVRKSS